MISVHNPTHRSKAVRVEGGHVVVRPGESAELTVELDQEVRRSCETAGLVFGGGSATPSDGAGHDSSDDATSAGVVSERTTAILAVVEAFDEDNEDLWTSDGRPDVNAINRALPAGMDTVSASERDAAWSSREV